VGRTNGGALTYIINLNKMGGKYALLLLVLTLLGWGHCADWMAGGNWTVDNFTLIRGIVAGFNPALEFDKYTAWVTNTSNDLNDLWDPAWNVVVVYPTDLMNYDSVLYGYAYREHWFWSNGHRISNDGYITFIIWKDYNCLKWTSYNSYGFFSDSTSNFDNSINFDITQTVGGNTNNAARNVNDIWKMAQHIQSVIPTSGGLVFQEKTAYTVIASQANDAQYYGRFCAKAYMVLKLVGNKPGSTFPAGSVMFLQMRDA
jgi:hypothetical protein